MVVGDGWCLDSSRSSPMLMCDGRAEGGWVQGCQGDVMGQHGAAGADQSAGLLLSRVDHAKGTRLKSRSDLHQGDGDSDSCSSDAEGGGAAQHSRHADHGGRGDSCR
eukprot:scaffold167795_cov15-Tisochrysis_lutea.AAC.1